MNIGKIRRFLRRAERVLGFVEGTRYGHHRRSHHYGRRRRRRVGDEVLRHLLRRIR